MDCIKAQLVWTTFALQQTLNNQWLWMFLFRVGEDVKYYKLFSIFELVLNIRGLTVFLFQSSDTRLSLLVVLAQQLERLVGSEKST